MKILSLAALRVENAGVRFRNIGTLKNDIRVTKKVRIP